MIYLVYGKNGTGKSEFLRNRIISAVSIEPWWKNFPSRKKMYLITPEQFTFESEKAIFKELSDCAAQKMQSMEITSFTALSRKIVSMLSDNGVNFIDDSTACAFFSLVIDKNINVLKRLKKYSKTPDSVLLLYSFLNELIQNKIKLNDVLSKKNINMSKMLTEKLQDIELLFNAYKEFMKNAGIDNDFSVQDIAVKTLLYGNNAEKIFGGTVVGIDAFSGFTAQQRKIIEIIMKNADQVYISLCCDNVEINSFSFDRSADSRYSVFDKVYDEAFYIKKFAKENHIEVVEISKSDRLKLLNKAAFVYDNKPLSLKNIDDYIFSSNKSLVKPFNDDAVKIFKAKDKYEEAELCAAYIKNYIVENKLKYSDVLCIQGETGIYENELKMAFDKYKIPIYFDRRVRIDSSPLIVFVDSLLLMCSEGINTERLIRFLHTGLTNLDFNEISKLENYADVWDINGEKQWLKPFENDPDGLVFLDDDFEKIKNQNDRISKIEEIRIKAISDILEFKRIYKLKETRAFELSRFLYDFLSKNIKNINCDNDMLFFDNEKQNIGKASEQNEIWLVLVNILDTLYRILKNENDVNKAEFYKLFKILVNQKSLGEIPQNINAVSLGDAERVRTGGKKLVFILGANYGVFPKLQNNSGILTPKEKAEFNEIFSENNLENRFWDEPSYFQRNTLFNVYHAVSTATEHLVLSYSENDYSGKILEYSELVSEIMKITAQTEKNILSAVNFKEPFFTIYPETAFDFYSKNFLHKTSALEAVKEAVEEYTNEYTVRFDGLDFKKKMHGEKLDKSTAEKLYYNDKILDLSASRVENYYTCPFKFFMSYGLKISKIRKATELDSFFKGSVMHFVLQNLLDKDKFGKEKLLSEDETVLKKVIVDYLSEYLEKYKLDMTSFTEIYKWQYKYLMTTLLLAALRLKKQLKECRFEPLFEEFELTDKGKAGSFVLNRDNDEKIRISGFVDRVDISTETEEQRSFKIIDYKMGGKNFDIENIKDGLNMQMLIYMIALKEKAEAGKISELYKSIPYGIEYFAVKSENLPDILRNEDIFDEKYFNKIKLASVSKEIKIDSETFKDVNEKVMSKLWEMYDELLSGSISASFAKTEGSQSAYKNSCTYCDFKNVCGVAENSEFARKISEKNG